MSDLWHSPPWLAFGGRLTTPTTMRNVLPLLLLCALVSSAGAQTRADQQLLRAAQQGNVVQVQQAAAQGADLNRQGPKGWAPAHHAAALGHVDVLVFLASRRADLNAQTLAGRSPLMMTAEAGYDVATRFLRCQGAIAYLTDIDGRTALDLARDAQHDFIAEFLDAPDCDRERLLGLVRAEQLEREVTSLYQSERYGDALEPAREMVRLKEAGFGANYPGVAPALNSLVAVLEALELFPEARSYYLRLARLFDSSGNIAGARSMYERALVMQEQELGGLHPDVAESLHALGRIVEQQQEWDTAELMYERSATIYEAAEGAQSMEVANVLEDYASLRRKRGRFAESEALLERALAITEQNRGLNAPEVAAVLGKLAELSEAQGEYGESRARFQRALTIVQRALGTRETLQVLLDAVNTSDDALARR